MNKTNKQYNNFHNSYSDNREVNDHVGNNDFYQMFNFEVGGKRLLDVGCGDGDDMVVFKSKGAEVEGVDPSDAFVQGALKRGLSAKVGLGEDLPFYDDTFDFVVSKYAIQNSLKVKAVLSESCRVLKKGGVLHILVKHPFRQFLEKKKFMKKPVNYFIQQITKSVIFKGLITLEEPTHVMEDYFNADFFSKFNIIDFRENFDFPASEQIDGDIYPTYFVLTASKK